MIEPNQLSSKKQKILIFLCWLVYTMSYLGRYSYKSNIINFNVADSKVTGLVMSLFYGAYGAGQIINGLLCHKYNKKLVLTIVCISCAVLNLTIAFGIPFKYFQYLWLLNGVCLSVLWSSLILVLSENLEQKYLKTAIFLMSTTVPVGTFMVYGASALFSALNITYHATFLLSGVCIAVAGIVWFLFYDKNTLNNKIATVKEGGEKESTGKNKIASSLIIMVVIISIFAIVCNLVKDGLQTWTPSVLVDNFPMLGNSLSTMLTLFLPVVGVFGSVLAITMQNKLKNYIIVLGILFMVAGGMLTGVMFSLTNSWVLAILFMSIANCMAQASNNVITSIVPLELRDKINSGLLAGILNGFCYIGSTISGYGLGAIADRFGWSGMFVFYVVLCIMIVVVSIVYLLLQKLNKKAEQK